MGEYNKPICEALRYHSKLGIFSVCQGPWKLIFGVDSGGEKDREHVAGNPSGQLYNFVEDPAEKINLWNKRQDIVKQLSALLQ